MSKQVQKGTSFETAVCNYLNHVFGGSSIERRAKNGAHDRGDISGVFFNGLPVAVEVKNCKRTELAKWVEEAEVERGNSDSALGVVVHKRPRVGLGIKTMGNQYVTMTLGTFAAMIAGGPGLLED